MEEAHSVYELCNDVLGILKKSAETNSFKNKAEEIHFFKNVKVEPMKYLVYYTEVRFCELRMPKIGPKHQLQFLEEQLNKVNSFFNKYTEFLIYMEEGYTHLDKHYFTRKNTNNFPTIKSYPYFKDQKFNTSHDEILAKIKGFGLYVPYLIKKKKELQTTDNQARNNTLKWTGTYASFIELIYGCQVMGYFNHGILDIKTILQELGQFLDVPKGNPSRTYNEIKNRKSTRIKFFEEAGKKLLDKMDREDGIEE
ncbi:MAG: RteC domain-containing protein [Bacteroidota bacterium]